MLSANGMAAEAASAPDASQWSDSLVGSAIAKDVFPGAVVVVVRKSDPPFIKGYGIANVLTRQPVDPDRTMLQIGSITKLFTAIVTLQLVDEGRLSLDADVSKYLKRFQLQRPDLGPMTIHDLLTHQAGFDSSLIGTIFDDPNKVEETPRQLRRMFIRVRRPRELVSYDNLGVGLLGLILEDITGDSYGQLLRMRIFAPLGMDSSIVGFDPRYGSRLAGCAVPDGHGGWEYCAWRYSPQRDAPAGGIYTTGSDLAKFMSALLANGEYPGGRLMSAASWARFTDFDNERINPGLPGIGLLALQQAPVERGDWGHDGGGYGSVNTLYVSPRGHTAGFLGVTGGEKDVPLSLSGIFEYFSSDAAREEQFGTAYQLLKEFDRGIAKLAVVPDDALRPPVYTQPPFTQADLARLQGWYFPARRWNYAPLLGRFLPALLPWTHIEAADDGTLSVDGRGPWRQIAPRLFEDTTGHRLGFEIHGNVITAGTVSHSRLERHGWWALPIFTVEPFFAFALFALSGFSLVLGRRRAPSVRRLGWLAALGGALMLVSLAFEFEYGPALYVADRDMLALTFRIPMQIGLFMLAAAPFAFAQSLRVSAWRAWPWRLYGGALSFASVFAFILAGYFGLIGHLNGV